jgi:hypothetical protein
VSKKQYLLAATFLVGSFSGAHAAADTWQGGGSPNASDWNQANNWNNGVPTTTSQVTVPSGTANTPVITHQSVI